MVLLSCLVTFRQFISDCTLCCTMKSHCDLVSWCEDIVQKLSCDVSQVVSLTSHGAERCLVSLLSVDDVSLLHCILRSLNNFTRQ